MKRTELLKKHAARLKLPLFIVIGFVIGFLLRGGNEETHIPSPQDNVDITVEASVEVWTCAMHPQIRLPKPGKCPICGMDLIPVTGDTSGDEVSPRELSLSPRAAKLAEVEVARVERKFVQKEIRMVGKVDYDETRLSYITAWLPGRIDRLYVDYTGITVRKGDHLVYIYSPELLTAQEELIQALIALEELKSSKLITMQETALGTIEAVREKLRLLGLTQDQITEFEERGKPIEHVTIYSPIAGIVIHKSALEGMYVSTGTKIYTIADLSYVWVKLDVYESDLAWIRYGQKVEFYTEAYPGEVFTGRIAFIDPVLNEKTRTVKVRVNVPNLEGKLKPEMFVRSVVYSSVAEGGKVMDSSIANSYICPMHPEIVKSSPGVCDICEMDLVKAETLGYTNSQAAEPPLVIPASAPLITGKRAVVYVSVPGKKGTYDGRVVVLGPRTSDYYQVKEGLAEGELVVVKGNFKIDSAIQILAKPSMMSPEGGVPAPAHHHEPGVSQQVAEKTEERAEPHTEHTGSDMKDMKMGAKVETLVVPDAFKIQLDSVYTVYFGVHHALSQDSLEYARKSSSQILAALKNVDMNLVTGEAHKTWMDEMNIIRKNCETIAEAQTIDDARKAFIPLSASLIRVVQKFGATGAIGIYRFNCPMANDGKGADWLQNTAEIANPYYGSSMLTCGSLEETISEGSESDKNE